MADDIERGVADYLADPTAPVFPRLRDSIGQAYGQAPDMAADLARAARATGVPLPAAEVDPDYVRREAWLQDLDVDNLTVTAPRTASWLTTPQHAKMAHDDLDVLQSIEQVGRNLLGLGKASAMGFGSGMLAAAQATNAALFPGGVVDFQGNAIFGPGSEGDAATTAARKRLAAGVKEAMPKTSNWFEAGVNAGVVSFFQNAPATLSAILTRNPKLGLGMMGATAGGNAYGEAVDKGLPQGQAIAYGAVQGAVEVVTEKGPLDELLGDVAVGSGVFKTWWHQFVKDAPGEQIATVVQDFNEWAVLNPDKPFTSYLAARPEAAATTLVASAVGSTGNTALQQVGRAAERVAQRRAPEAQRAEQGQQQAAAVQDFMAAAEGSRLRERDPQTFEEFVAHATRDTPIENVYVDAETLVDALAQGSPEKLREATDVLQALPSIGRQLDQAVSMGGVIEIPVSEFAAWATGTPLAQTLLPHLRTDPAAMSQAEAEAFMQEEGQALEAEVQQVVAEQGIADDFQASADRIRDEIAAQLDKAGRFTPDVNAGYAQLTAAFYATQAQRLGITPEDMFARHPLQIQAQGVTADSFMEDLPPELQQDGAEVPARVLYRGTTGSADKIRGGLGEGLLFAAAEEEIARLYGDNIEKIAVKPEAKVLVEGSAEFAKLTGRRRGPLLRTMRKGENIKTAADDAIGKAKAAGYDAVEFNSMRDLGIAIINQTAFVRDYSDDLEQAAPRQPRATYSPIGNIITLLRGADLSSFIHESGHFYLETLARMAAQPDAPDQVREDFAGLMRFMATAKGGQGAGEAVSQDAFGQDLFEDSAEDLEQAAPTGANSSRIRADLTAEQWLALPVDERRAGHELIARGFERYLMEGKAPSLTLQSVFQRMKAWLVNIYQKLSNLNAPIDDEVRGVFDRLIASETEIAQAEHLRRMAPVFETKPPSMNDAEWAAYQRLGEQATADAEDELQARSVRDMQWLSNARDRLIKQLQKDARELRKAVRAEVEAEVLVEPVYAAREFLKRGTLPAGLEWEGSTKLAIGEVEKLYAGTPKELQDWKRLGYGKYGMLAEEGLSPDQAAELFGFSSGDHLIEELLNAEDPKAKIEGMTDQRMLERHGDLIDDDSIKAAADKAIHNDARLRFVATEANALAKAAGKKRILAEAAKNYAAQLIGGQRIRDLKPSRYTSAEAKAAANAAKLAAQGKLEEAAMAKRNQLINGYAAKATFDAKGEVDKALRLFARLDSPAARKSIDADYRDQIDQLLERFDLRKGESLRAIDKRKSLAAWIEKQRAVGFEPVIDPDLENEAFRKHYRDMTVEELRGLVDAVRNIIHLGRLKNRLLMAAKQRAFDAVRDEMVQTVTENAYKTNPAKREFNTLADGLRSGFNSVLAVHRKLPSLMREMGGGKDRTILWDAIVRPMNEQFDWEAVRREEATKALAALYDPLIKAGGLKRKLYIPAIGDSMTLEGRLAVALNWGNELNRARILDGEKWDPAQVEAIFATLTPEQLGFVNGVWAYLDSYWPEVAAKQRRVTGVEPQRTEPTPFQITAADGSIVDMRGGYYPIKYETKRSDRSAADEKAETLMAAKRGLYAASTTRRGHTKARVEKVERPVRYDLMVPFQHVSEVIHDLAFHEYLIDANRLIGSRDFEMAVRAHYSPEVLAAIKDTLEAVAVGDLGAENGLEKAVAHLRTGTTIAGLGFNLMTSLLQPLGLTQSIARVGPKWMARAIGRCMTDAVTLQNTVEAIGAKSDFMRLRSQTFMREINEVSNKVKGGLVPEVADRWFGPAAPAIVAADEAVRSSFFWTIGKLQLVADIPTWLAQYDKSIAAGEAEDTAIKLADQAVRDAQGSGLMGDLAGVQRGNVWMKLWSTFYSYFSVANNLLSESVAQARRDPAHLGKLASDFFLIAFLPTALGELLKNAVKGDWEDWPEDLAKAEISFLMGTFLGLREFGAIVQYEGKLPAMPGGLRILSDSTKLGSDIATGIRTGDLPDRTRKDVVSVAGIVFHLPASQINRTWDGIDAMAKGETRNPLALAFGPPKTP